MKIKILIICLISCVIGAGSIYAYTYNKDISNYEPVSYKCENTDCDTNNEVIYTNDSHHHKTHHTSSHHHN